MAHRAVDLTINTPFNLPDFVTSCPVPLRKNPLYERLVDECTEWFCKHHDDDKKRDDFFRANGTLLACLTFPDAAYPELRTCSDFCNWLFHLDNLTDDMSDEGTSQVGLDIMHTLQLPGFYTPVTREGQMAKDYWQRMLTTATPGTQRRFIEAVHIFLQAVTQQASHREAGLVLELEPYIRLRRKTSGCRINVVFVEYAAKLDLPNEVFEHPVIRELEDMVNDLIAWPNDLHSYFKEISKGDPHNILAVIMTHQNLNIQAAADFVGELWHRRMDSFVQQCANLPSWNADLDKQVKLYVDGMTDSVVACMHWAYESERYFGKYGSEAKQTRIASSEKYGELPFFQSRNYHVVVQL